MPGYKLSTEIVFEAFKDGGLVLILPERRLLELNPTAVDIVKLLNGNRTCEQIVNELVKSLEINGTISKSQINRDVSDLIEELNQKGVLEFNPELQESVNMPTDVKFRFLRNPDVVLREEDPDEGALLFNPDTNQVKVINTTGLFIWRQCGIARTLDEIVAEVQKGFDDVPSEQVAHDVKEFVDNMLASGFIGTVKPGK
jgi:hypothetical protein